MAKQEHVEILKQGVEIWNKWREENRSIRPDLSNANFEGADLSKADLSSADLEGADFSKANLIEANLSKANLSGAFLGGANLSKANLSMADLSWASLSWASLSGADLSMANLVYANLNGCNIFGISAWNINVEGAIQKNLVITDEDEPRITIDNLKVAQFIYLLLNNEEIRDVINTITSKVVLILGRFTNERKLVLDALRDDLRKHNYLPVVFDFEKPSTRDLTETVSTLAHLARFIILDLTDPSSAPHEAATIIPHCIVPVQPLLLQDNSRYEYAMFQDLRQRYHWVLPTYRYQDTLSLLASLKEYIIDPAEQKAQELDKRK